MPRLRTDNYRRNIIKKNKFFSKRTVKKKKKFMLRMIFCNSLQRFIREPTDAFKFIFEKKSCVNGNEHCCTNHEWLRMYELRICPFAYSFSRFLQSKPVLFEHLPCVIRNNYISSCACQ